MCNESLKMTLGFIFTRGVRPLKTRCHVYDIKLHLIVSSGDLGSVEHPFIAFTPKTTLTRNGSTC